MLFFAVVLVAVIVNGLAKRGATRGTSPAVSGNRTGPQWEQDEVWDEVFDNSEMEDDI